MADEIMRGRFKGALIDMDGVLFDSMKGHTRAWQEMMRTFCHGVTDEEAKRIYAIKTERFRSYGPAPLIEGADRMLRSENWDLSGYW
jgi:beta-phosphoglucomutase-like phosphatase (HAD superfamily)